MWKSLQTLDSQPSVEGMLESIAGKAPWKLERGTNKQKGIVQEFRE